MLMHMSNGKVTYGPLLMSYLEARWAALGTTQTAFARESRIEGSNFTNWGKGTDPGLRWYRMIADALGESPIKLLAEIGFLTSNESAGLIPTPDLAVTLDDHAGDPDVPPKTKLALRRMWDALRDVDPGGEADVSVNPPARR
jgi:hypothetical protein